ncbi:MAG: hypothetical protein ACRELT_16240 [Longimicrobiales bacterium]
MFSVAALVQGDGLTIGEVVRGIPHDGPAIVIYVMILVFAGFIWHGSRKKPT